MVSTLSNGKQGVYGYAIGGSGRLRGGSRGVGGITQRVRVGKGGGVRLRDAGRVSRSFSS